MFVRSYIVAAALVAGFALSPAPAIAIDGQVLITHAAALAGAVTPGDPPGYPVEINIPGSYKLGSHLVPPLAATGIYVLSPNVTIDLNGFTLQGSNIANIGIISIQFNGTIRNGYITRFRSTDLHHKQRLDY